MTEREIRLSGLSDPQETDLDQYRAVSGSALAGLIVSLASPVALAHPFMWPVPVVGIVICVLALRHIAREAPALIGRKAALAGVAVAVLFAAAAISQWYTYGRLLDKEAQRFAAQWFDLLRQDQREKSFELTRHPRGRSPLDENLPSHYLPGSDERDELNNYLQKPGVQALVALGDKARFRHYRTERRSHSRGGDLIN
ncbi:MAG: hypothetical protein HQ582_26980, partial [Planctomycetes bacterium]|nr:hypothetical protein [Planctomycetota bacterium]